MKKKSDKNPYLAALADSYGEYFKHVNGKNKKNKKKKPAQPKIDAEVLRCSDIHERAQIGMSDFDIAKHVGLSEDELIKRYFKPLSEGRIHGIYEVSKTAYQMSKSGAFPAITKFWLQVQAKWVENHTKELEHKQKQDVFDEQEYDFSRLTKDELSVFKKLAEKARKIPARPDSGSGVYQLAEGMH